MRFFLPTLALFTLASVTAPAVLAQTNPSVAVIDFQSAVLATQEFDKAYNDLQTKYKPVQDKVLKMQQDLSDIETQLRAAAGQLSSAGQAELETRGARTQRELERISQDAEDDFGAERDDALRLVSARMSDVLQKLAEQRGVDVVVDLTVAPYFKDALDLTQASIDAYNAAYPVAAK